MPHRLAARLQVKHLRLIAAITDQRQLSLAAAALAITQPAASRMLAEIEGLTGTPLFERHPRGMTLTTVGEGLARHARNILDEVAEAADEVEKLRLGHGGVVQIGAVTGAAVGYVVPAIRRLKSVAPEVELHVQVSTSDDLIKGLMSMHHDMVLGRLPPGARLGDFNVQRALGERVRIVTNAANPFAGRAEVSRGELSGSEWVMQGPGAPIRQAIDEAFLDLAVAAPRNVTNTASLLVTLALLREREVVTPVSQEVASLLTGTHSNLVELTIREDIRVAPYSLVTLKTRRLSPAAARCRDLLSEVLRQE
ncbi:HTH-type transcriptional regulator GbpR [mine drainage metagenome]|uniref:HTH-type transcriptional regulator GbpR n=1 Tax=mine drainage metagenome TaxID=410659 RepID=A0A1J5PJY3_9ZZZZ